MSISTKVCRHDFSDVYGNCCKLEQLEVDHAELLDAARELIIALHGPLCDAVKAIDRLSTTVGKLSGCVDKLTGAVAKARKPK